MRKIVSIFNGICFAGLILLAGACADSVGVSNKYKVAIKAYYIHPDETSFNFTSDGGSKTFTVYAQDTPWEISLDSDWLSVSPSSGSTTTTVTLTAKPNPRAVARNVQFTLKSATPDWSYSSMISASSQAAIAYANPETHSISVSASAASITLSVDSNCDYYVNSDSDWVTVDRVSESQVDVHIAENGTRQARSTHFYFNYNMGGTLAIIEVNQQMPNVSVTTNTLEYGINGGAYRLNINSDVSWRLETSQSFIDARTASGGTTGEPGTTEVIIEASPNASYQERSGYVYLSLSQERWAQIPVHQEAVYLRLKNNSTEHYTSARANTSHIEIESNAKWVTSGWPSWATPLATSGSGNQSIEISVQENEDMATERSATITMKPDMTGSSNKTFVLRQRHYDLNLQEQTILSCNDLAQDLSFKIFTDADWTTYTELAWLSTTPERGSMDAEIAVHVLENTGEKRTGNAFVKAFNLIKSVSIVQDSWVDKYHYDPNPVEIPTGGGSAVIHVSTNDRWTARIDEATLPDWVQVSGLEGRVGDGDITVTFTANPSINARGVNLMITYDHDNGQHSIVSIRQEGRDIQLNCAGIFFFAKGGSTSIRVIRADGDYEIEQISGSDWFSVQQGQNNTFTVTASVNETGAERTGAIHIFLKNLNPGESKILTVMVTQVTREAGFIRTGWDQDVDLNTYSDLTGIQVTGFSEDEYWGGKEAYTGTVTVTGYDEDSEWNNYITFSVVLTGFLPDEDLSNTSTGTNIGGEGYDDDENWD